MRNDEQRDLRRTAASSEAAAARQPLREDADEARPAAVLSLAATAAAHAATGSVAADRAVAAVPLAVVKLSGHPAAAAPAALRRRRRICPPLVQPGPERGGRRPRPGWRMRTLPLPLPPPEGAREAEEALRLHLGPRATEAQEGEGRQRQRVGEETVEVSALSALAEKITRRFQLQSLALRRVLGCVIAWAPVHAT